MHRDLGSNWEARIGYHALVRLWGSDKQWGVIGMISRYTETVMCRNAFSDPKHYTLIGTYMTSSTMAQHVTTRK